MTPIMTSRTLNRRISAEAYLKCENFQRVGAFKFRGAYNAISRLTEQERARGVITYSSGNHAQAVALVGKLLGVQAVIVMPRDAPAIKRAATEGYGARVVEYDPETGSREEVARDLQMQHGYTMIPPFDHLDVIAGQGTAALEMFEEVGRLDMLLVPCGGGGLLSGSAIAAKHMNPACRVIGIQSTHHCRWNSNHLPGQIDVSVGAGICGWNEHGVGRCHNGSGPFSLLSDEDGG